MFKIVTDINVSKNFKLSEFVCKEGKNEALYDCRLIMMLQEMREKIGRPIIINSGYRSPAYNKKINGSPKSQHILGKAADIRIVGFSPEEIAKLAVKMGFTGIGIYDTFTHVDVRDNPHPRGYAYWDMR
ncbi:YcbK family protein [Marinisporobacter balticus]|uniref:Murein endopeptidase K n=1 Tax=Marinisporobacter balticus TaxID=2018667 RepID=A0A4R2KVY3_9FIRM|nr:D-Ala-D-Ala carboxypeptidase family metallohydrolase [Marinisporobacter balticus]TCO78003.1 peptidase M15-like protein [Marinisporobacter balticus]